MKIKKGDKVKVITGKYKGTEGVVIKSIPKKNLVIVDGVNVKKKAIKQKGADGNNFDYILHPIHVSNVKLVDRPFKEKNTDKKEEYTNGVAEK